VEFERVTYEGPPIDDPTILTRLSADHRALLESVNGLIAFGGGLHLRGASRTPAWHSLRHAWDGPTALHNQFRAVRATDVPFAQDALGDQYLLRDDQVWRLTAESGDLAPLGVELNAFLAEACNDPVANLSLEPLEEFVAQGGELQPGQLLSVYPPFVVKTDSPPSYRAIPVHDRLVYLANLARQIGDLPDGTEIEFKIVE
jgi:hypothetical protein